MKAYHNSVVLRNDGEDPSTFNLDLNAGITKQVTVRINSTQALAVIFDVDDVGTANPLTTDNNGNYAFKAADNIYDIIVSEGTANEVKLEKVEIAEIPTAPILIGELSLPYNFDTITDLIGRSITLIESKIVTTTGKLLITDGQGARYRITTSVPDDLFKNINIGGGQYAIWLEGIGPLTSRTEDIEFKAEDAIFGGTTATQEGGGVLVLADSNGEGFGATSYDDGYLSKITRCIYNSVDGGTNQDRGFRYETIMNLANQLEQPGVSTTGTLETVGGSLDSFISLTAGQTITVTGRQITFNDVYYTGATGSLEFRLNGLLYNTKVLTTGSGAKTTFPTQINVDGSYIKESDTLTITATATCAITGLLTLRTSNANYSPHVIAAPKSGWALDNFNAATRAEDISNHMNLIKGAGKKIAVMVMLGTNDIYNPSHADTPVNYIAQLTTLISEYTTHLTGDPEFIIEIPPKAAPPTVTVTGDEYGAYVFAIIEFCQANGYQMIRIDKTKLSGDDTYLIDTIHFDNVGSVIMAKELSRVLSIPYNSKIDRTELSEPPLDSALSVGVTYNDTWGDFSNANYTVTSILNEETGVVTMKGMAQPNASVSTTVCTLTLAHRPIAGRSLFASSRDDMGFQGLEITPGGDLIIGAINSWISFDSLSFRVY